MFVFNLPNLLVAVAFGVVFGEGRCRCCSGGFGGRAGYGAMGCLSNVYLLSSVNFCCGAPDLVTTTLYKEITRPKILPFSYQSGKNIPFIWQQGVASFAITANTVICPLPSCVPDITITKYHFPTLITTCSLSMSSSYQKERHICDGRYRISGLYAL